MYNEYQIGNGIDPSGGYNLFRKPIFMKKVWIIVVVIIIGIGGFLGWDWYDNTRRQRLEPSITLYYWTDAQGNKHFTDTPPPKGARDIHQEKGYKHIKPPLIMTIKNKAVELYKKTKEKFLGKRKSKRIEK